MRKPTIHLNGSSAQSLFDAYYAALKAVKAAQAKLHECAPHGRDYYVQTPTPASGNAITEAIAEHRARMEALESVERELETLALHVMETSNGKVTR